MSREKVSPGRKVIRIEVSPEADAIIEGVADQYDMYKTGVASRMYEWFGRQPPEIQKWVMGLVTGKEGQAIHIFKQALAAIEGAAELPALPDDRPPRQAPSIRPREPDPAVPPRLRKQRT